MKKKTFKPTSPGRRFATSPDFSNLTEDRPWKALTKGKSSTGGRESRGRIAVRFRGGGHKRLYRTIDFRREKDGIPARVETIEYDPNRSARIARLVYRDGERRYILSPDGLEVGRQVMSGAEADILPGNCLTLSAIPPGTMVHAIEMRPSKGAQMVRSAGTAAQLLAKEGRYAQLRLPSGEVRKIHLTCRATIGQVGNIEHENVKSGKAGRSRHLGRRPHNRGVSMNPVDHPMGGGEGKASGGRHPCSPWGWPTKGYKTRKNRKSDKQIVRKRSRKSRR